MIIKNCFFILIVYNLLYGTNDYADMAELADALVSGSSGKPCRFKSCYPHQK